MQPRRGGNSPPFFERVKMLFGLVVFILFFIPVSYTAIFALITFSQYLKCKDFFACLFCFTAIVFAVLFLLFVAKVIL
jgi:hypothetical protein